MNHARSTFACLLFATALGAQNLPGNSNPNGFVADPLGTYALFAANDQSTGMELWRTDFFTGATTRVADIRPGAQAFRRIGPARVSPSIPNR